MILLVWSAAPHLDRRPHLLEQLTGHITHAYSHEYSHAYDRPARIVGKPVDRKYLRCQEAAAGLRSTGAGQAEELGFLLVVELLFVLTAWALTDGAFGPALPEATPDAFSPADR